MVYRATRLDPQVNFQGMNVGKDVSVKIMEITGETKNHFDGASLGILTHFKIDTVYRHSTMSSVSTGKVRTESIPGEVKVEMKFVRRSPALEDLEKRYRSNYKNGIKTVYVISYSTRTKSSLSGLGPIVTSRVLDCKPVDFQLGHYNPDNPVEQSVTFHGSEIEEN